MYIAGEFGNVDVSARGPRLMNLMVERSEAEKTLAVLTIEDVKGLGGVRRIFEVLDEAYPEKRQPQKLVNARKEVMAHEWNFEEETEKEINRYRRALK